MESSEQKYKKIGRNKVCFCGSGIKFKKCCLYKYHILDKDKIGIETANLNAVEYKITYDALPSPDLDQFKREDRDLFTKIFDKMQESICNFNDCIIRLERLKIKYPESKRIYNLLSVCYERIGDKAKAYRLLIEQNEKFPDYIFSKLNLANHFFQEKEHKKIFDLLEGKFDLKALYPKRDVFHISEFSNFMAICGGYFAREGDIENARMYLDILLKLDDCDSRLIGIVKQEIEDNSKKIKKEKPGLLTRIKEIFVT